MKRKPITNYCATVFDMRGQSELGTVIAGSYAAVWLIAKGMTLHPMLEWIEGGPTGREIV